jgi:DNA-binding transcriptional MerR regulator
MFKIGEFSRLGQVTVRTLRHYDDLGLLRPAFIDPESDYRYYTIEQLPHLNRIVALKDLGLTLDQIATLLMGEVSAERLRGMLQLRQAEIAQRVQDDQAQLARVAARLRQIEREGKVSPYEIARKEVPAQVIATIRQVVPNLNEIVPYRCSLYDELYAWLNQRGITPIGPELALYHNTDFVEQEIDMELGVVVPASTMGTGTDRVTIATLPATAEIASVTHYGDVWDLPLAFVALFSWMEVNHYTVAGPSREIHLYGRENDQHRWDRLVLEVQLPVTLAVD